MMYHYAWVLCWPKDEVALECRNVQLMLSVLSHLQVACSLLVDWEKLCNGWCIVCVLFNLFIHIALSHLSGTWADCILRENSGVADGFGGSFTPLLGFGIVSLLRCAEDLASSAFNLGTPREEWYVWTPVFPKYLNKRPPVGCPHVSTTMTTHRTQWPWQNCTIFTRGLSPRLYWCWWDEQKSRKSRKEYDVWREYEWIVKGSKDRIKKKQTWKVLSASWAWAWASAWAELYALRTSCSGVLSSELHLLLWVWVAVTADPLHQLCPSH